MPTIHIQYRDRPSYSELLRQLVNRLPAIVAPEMSIPGRELHDGGVGESEIIIDATQYSEFARNVNDVQITVRAHRFEERVARLNQITESIKQGVSQVIVESNYLNQKIKVGLEVDLVEMGYVTIGKD